jgi:hypothetical protein
LCKDPIWSFICPRCLARDIVKWLPEKLRGAFKRFNRDFSSSFSATIDMAGLTCLSCRKVRVANICPFCYLAEVCDWLHEIKPALAEVFFRSMPLKRSLRITGSGVAWKDGIVPISQTEPQELDEGTCEACERYSDELIHTDGRWLCRDCESLEG